jgi:hypothetical protein
MIWLRRLTVCWWGGCSQRGGGGGSAGGSRNSRGSGGSAQDLACAVGVQHMQASEITCE